MTAIWQNDGSGWHLLSPTGFPNEEKLHTLVEKAPHLLPLAGTPRLIVLGREVQLGNGYADLIAIEPTGRIAIIEIKLARNAEARRAAIAQVLAYAAYLWKLDQTTLEQEVLNKHLRNRGYKSLARIDQSIMPIRQKKTTREVSNELLDALTDAYREAVGGEIEV